MSGSRPISSSLLAETDEHRFVRRFNLRRSLLYLIDSSSSRSSIQTIVSMHISRPKTVWQNGMFRAKKIWRKALRRQRRKSAAFGTSEESHASFLVTNVPAPVNAEQSPLQPWLQLGEVGVRQTPTIYECDQQRNSSTPSIVRTSPSNKHYSVHVGTSVAAGSADINSNQASSVHEKRKSVRYSHPALTRIVVQSPRASDADTSRDILNTPRSGPGSSHMSRSTASTATSVISGKTTPFAHASLALKSRQKSLTRLQSLNRIDGVRGESQQGIIRTTRKHRARREASVFGNGMDLPYFALGNSRHCLQSLTEALEGITGDVSLEAAQQRQDALAMLEGHRPLGSDVERTLTDHRLILEWAQTAEVGISGRRSTQWPGQPHGYSQYVPLPAVMEHTEAPAPAPPQQLSGNASIPPRRRPPPARVVEPQTISSPSEVAPGDKGKQAADPHIQHHLDATRRQNIAVRAQMEQPLIPTSLRPPTPIGNVSENQVPLALRPAPPTNRTPPIRESRYNHALPPLPSDEEPVDLPVSWTRRRKPLPGGSAAPVMRGAVRTAASTAHYQHVGTQTETEPPPPPQQQQQRSRKRDVVAQVMLKTYYYR